MPVCVCRSAVAGWREAECAEVRGPMHTVGAVFLLAGRGSGWVPRNRGVPDPGSQRAGDPCVVEGVRPLVMELRPGGYMP